METRGNWSNQVPDVGLKLAEFFDQGQMLYTPGIFNILTKRTGDGAQKNYESITTAGEAKKVEEGASVPTATRALGYVTKVAYTKYGKALDVTQEMMEDRDFDAVFSEAQALGRALNVSMDKSGVQLFNGGFATTTNVNGYDMTWYGDGKPNFSTIHPTKVPGGSTQSNASSTSIPFGHDNLETAHIALIQQKLDDGLPVGYNGKPTLVVPTALMREAQEETMSELDPSNANNNINVFRGRFDVASTVYLDATNSGSDTAWFLVTPGQDKQFFEIRKAPSVDMETAIKTGVSTFVGTARWAVWVGDWRMKWGSKGDSSAYSA